MTSVAPWTLAINNSPWTASQSLFPRVVAIHRINSVAGVGTDIIGGVGYSGAQQGTGVEGETTLLTGLRAWIQLQAGGRTTKSGELPGDAVTKPIWVIFIPGVPIYSIRDRDIIVDDEAYRYEVSANFWTPPGYQLSTVRQEA